MPDQPSWLERVPHILGQLSTPDAPPFLDRPAVELLFGLRRRQAIELMHRMAGYQVGRTFLVDRAAVAAFLGQSSVRQAAGHAVQRKRRVLDHLAEARRDWAARQIRIPVERAGDRLAGLPPGVELQPGRLTIGFAEPVELIEKLFALCQALAADFERFMGPVSAMAPDQARPGIPFDPPP